MADTVVNNPAPYPVIERDDSSVAGFFLAILLLLAVAFLLFWYGIPRFLSPRISVPDRVGIDVNVQTPNTNNK